MNYKINTEKIMFTQVGDDGVLYDTEENTYVSVNETLYKILRGIDAGLSKDEIVAQLLEEYDVSEEQCFEEVEAALEKLISKNIVTKNR